jgi:exonuclease SbcC
MIFRRLLGRKKQITPSPEDREGAFPRVPNDRDARARRDACRRVKRLSELRVLAFSDPDAGVREIALARYGELLCAKLKDAPELTERLEEIAALSDQAILEQVALGGQEAEVRRAAIDKITSPEVLATCALNDAFAANRRAAVDVLDDKSALARVAKNIGKKDTRVYRAARQRLRAITEREAQPERIRARCEDLCEKIERLGRYGHWVQDRALLDLLDRQWAQIEQEADHNRKARYQDLRGRFLRAYEEYRREHEARIAAEKAREVIRAEHRALLEELYSLSTLSDEAQMTAALERIAARWDELASSLPEKEQASLQRKYSTAREAAREHLEELKAKPLRNERLHQLLERAEQTLRTTKPLEKKQVLRLVEEAKLLLDAEGTGKSVALQLAEVREAIEERLRKQQRHAQKRLALLPGQLDELAGAIEKGTLKEAEPLYQSIVAGMELITVSGCPQKAYAQATTRLRVLATRLRELQKWRKWGTDQRREELCIAMEALGSENIHLEAMAVRMQDLQTQWKVLDKGGSPVNHPLWERFHTASERVYGRSKPYLDEQVAQREVNRQQRERLCQELETFLDQVDWERMDWKKAARAEREMRQAWSAIGAVNGQHRKVLEQRFRSAMKRLDGHLAEERGRNLTHKRELIARIEALAEEPDLGRATEETKRLQGQWQTTVPARQKEENRLWQRFRAASDAVFARRTEQQEAHAAELAENLRLREGLCAEAEGLVTSDSRADELTAALGELQRRWEDSEALPVPRQAAAGVSKRWRTARALVESRRRELLEEQRRTDLDLLADQAALCQRLERALEPQAETDADLAAVEADWTKLPKQRDADLQAAIEKRFTKALQACRQGGEELESLRAAFAAGRERRAELCLHLEILARIESPPQLAEERLRFQVTRLTEHMREGEKDPLEATSRLLQEWYLCSSAPTAEAAALEERFLRARRAIEATEPDDEAACRGETTEEGFLERPASF